jgi:V8-like Glu-specific endopeptidase
MMIDSYQLEAAKKRFLERKQQRERNLRLIGQKRYFEVDSPERVQKFLARRGFSPDETVQLLRRGATSVAAPATETVGVEEPNALERILGTNDLMGVAFLEMGLKAADTVGRIWIGVASGRPIGYGTGFLISSRLLLTNHHVLGDRNLARSSIMEFNYQVGIDGRLTPTFSYGMDPDTFHFADQHLDYAVVAVQSAASNSGRPLTDFGFNPMIEDEGKVIASQFVNIIQHPEGGLKQLALRENQIIDISDEFLQYQTDTAPGSSGSPVMNDRWEVVGLHHSGVWKTNAAGQVLSIDGQVWHEDMGEDRIAWIANEGVRLSKIIAHLRTQPMTGAQRSLFDEMINSGKTARTGSAPVPEKAAQAKTAGAAATSVGSVTVSPDGMATWSIPLTVSIRVGGVAVAGTETKTPPSSPVAVPRTAPTVGAPASSDNVNSILAAAQKEIANRPDVLAVRLGYVFKNGWITRDRALVVTVRRKQTPAALREARIDPLPETFRGLPVEVTNPTIRELLVATQRPAVTEAALVSDESILREEIKYFPPPDAPPLDRITAKMRVNAHVSPDHAFPELKKFLEATQRRLVIGMYDFGAPHIVDAVEGVGTAKTFKKLTMAIQHGQDTGKGTKADDFTDDQTVEKLADTLGPKFENAWVKIGSVNGWVAASYHIKVAVRDESAFWLSSGNWQSSNQPDADPLSENPQKREYLTKYNREWHAIVEHSALAKTYEAYLLNDFAQNRDNIPGEALEIPDLLLPAGLFVPSLEERAKPFKYFAPFDQNREFSVQPLLTPDNFHEQVLKLVESAEEQLLIQNQTFNAPKEQDEKLAELLDAVLAKQKAGVDVRVIFRVLYAPDARENLTNLIDLGFDENRIRVQPNCHTKGVIVDKKRVLLGSQNWSNLGVSNNRDASLLFDDAELANYFAAIFEHDWQNLAKSDIGHESLGAELATRSDSTPDGMVRLSWKDYQEML